jgi:hypothetical protein
LTSRLLAGSAAYGRDGRGPESIRRRSGDGRGKPEITGGPAAAIATSVAKWSRESGKHTPLFFAAQMDV